MADAPGTEDAAHLSYRLVNDLINLLREKGILTRTEVVTLLEKLANDLSQDRRAVAQRSVGHVRDTLIAEHQVVK